jgi:hypothetical protein
VIVALVKEKKTNPPVEPGGHGFAGVGVVTTNVVLPFFVSDAEITPEAATEAGAGC